ncbi:MAG TPA: FAD-binding oxidoreductase [Ramlibacter sp.]|uniref:FAD-binding oxidoreductase n=1 Tax=Ramlibacter sp. TaxID=1917967 RepID=UPI002CF9BB8C|nr:FAD-binding oxidoreductase [Ramlibacter sp.]HVZ45743.1 FAD-binding oxidoreductase [Ramlibacter sp.]
MTTQPTAMELLSQLAAAPGVGDLLPGATIPPAYHGDWMTQAPAGTALALARPRDTAEVSATLAACHRLRVPVVPQGGRTGLAGGATPVSGCVLLSLERMNRIEAVDAAGSTITVQAGATLQSVQEAARDAGLFFPLDLGARGSCHVGGNLSTNAGGNRVLRYGMARDLVLGLEAVTADGTVLSHLNTVLKDNTGFDMKQLFVGTEGTMGVIARAVLRLHPQPRSTQTALCALPDYASVLRLLRLVREGIGPTLSAFELMWPDFYGLVTTRVAGLEPPLAHGAGAYVLVESLGVEPDEDAARFERVLAMAMENGVVGDAVIAQSGGETAKLWKVRDASGELRSIFWPHVGFDVGIPTRSLGEFIEELTARLQQRWPQVRTVFFGHVGDSNVHIGVKVGDGEQPEAEIDDTVYRTVGDWRGSISAEHGIGLLKRAHLHHSRSPQELALLRTLKTALDPHGILNPGKVVPA